jgi:PIN domain nuclease of toxin-antitoxin system
MLAAVADTHAIIWYIFDDARLSKKARSFLDDAAKDGHLVGVSTITLAEIVYLSEGGRIHLDTLTRLVAALDNPRNVLTEIPFDRHIALTLSRVDRGVVPDLPDRIIAATALRLNVPLITRDGKIRLPDLQTVW